VVGGVNSLPLAPQLRTLFRLIPVMAPGLYLNRTPTLTSRC
jgi:hypothetical protein